MLKKRNLYIYNISNMKAVLINGEKVVYESVEEIEGIDSNMIFMLNCTDCDIKYLPEHMRNCEYLNCSHNPRLKEIPSLHYRCKINCSFTKVLSAQFDEGHTVIYNNTPMAFQFGETRNTEELMKKIRLYNIEKEITESYVLLEECRKHLGVDDDLLNCDFTRILRK